MSATIKNLESALAGESMAHIKYLYFAKLAEEQGFWEVADHFYWTADQEIKHAWGHLELLIGKPSVVESLEMAIAGETYEYTQMYPEFKQIATAEQNLKVAAEFKEQEAESQDHAQRFAEILQKAEKRFAALAKVEQKHAEAYKQILKGVDHE